MQQWFSTRNFTEIKDLIIAYSSLTIIYDPWLVLKQNPAAGSAFEWIRAKIEQSFADPYVVDDREGSFYRIPVCYNSEFGVDLEAVSEFTKRSVTEIIGIHQSKIYRVYMLGFLPGFAYLGKLDASLYMPRKEIPVGVTAGSVGIASNQTGIYPLTSPGGWQIIGRTPVNLFDATVSPPAKFQTGDHIQFYQITKEEFERT